MPFVLGAGVLVADVLGGLEWRVSAMNQQRVAAGVALRLLIPASDQ